MLISFPDIISNEMLIVLRYLTEHAQFWFGVQFPLKLQHLMVMIIYTLPHGVDLFQILKRKLIPEFPGCFQHVQRTSLGIPQ